MKLSFKSIFFGLAITSCIASANSMAAYNTPKDVDVKNGEKIYNTNCAVCHGEKGMADQEGINPPLNGQYARYMVTQLEAFADDRPKYRRDSVNSAMMIPFAKMLSKKEMWDVSVYLENIKERREFPKEWWDKNKDDLAWAQKTIPGICNACHGMKRAGRYPSGPKLAGLSAKYIEEQMEAFANGSRKGAQSMSMKLLTEDFPIDMARKIYIMIESDEEHK